MGKIFIILLIVTIAFQIIYRKEHEKLFWFFSGIMFVPDTFTLFETPVIMTSSRFLVYVLFLTAIFQNGAFKKGQKGFPLRKSLVLLFVLMLIIGLLDGRLTLVQKFYRPLSYFLENFSVLFLTYIYVKSVKDFTDIYKSIIKYFMFFALYGLVNYATRDNEFHTLISESFQVRNFVSEQMLSGAQRFRIASFAWHPIYYGFILAIGILMCLVPLLIINVGVKNRMRYMVILFLLIINLFLTNSRTPLFALSGGFLVFYLFAMNLKSKLGIAVLGFSFLVFATYLIPSANKIITESINTFSKQGSDLEGSSVEMRNLQLSASLVIFNRSPITGNGFNYIIEGLGFSSDTKKRSNDQDFFGFESYSYKLLIEQGLVGIAGNLILFISLLVFFLRNLRYAKTPFRKRIAVLSISMLATFLLFIFGTGDMGSFKFFMAILGLNIKGLQLIKEKELTLNKDFAAIKN